MTSLISLLLEATKYSESGFIDPSGTFYECEPYQHSTYAIELAKQNDIVVNSESDQNALGLLFNRGWTRISDGSYTVQKLDQKTASAIISVLRELRYAENERVSIYELENEGVGYYSESISSLEERYA